MAASVPISEAADVGTVTCDNVTLTIMDDEISINTSEPTDIQAHIHNYNTMAVTVSLSETSDSKVNVRTDESTIMVAAGSTADVVCHVSTDKNTNVGEYDTGIVLSVMDGINPVSSAVLNIKVDVTSHYASADAENRFMGIFENNLPSPFNEIWFTALATLLIWIALSLAVGYVLYDVLKLLFKGLKNDDSQFSKNTLYWLSLCVLIQGLINTLAVMGVDSHTMEEINKWASVVYVPLVAMIVWNIYKTVIYNALWKSEQKNLAGVDTSLVPLFNLIGELVIIVTSITVVLSIFNVDIAAIIAAAGIAGLGISLGAKPMINQFISGLVLMIVRPFRKGDIVKIGSSDAMIVDNISILQTEFRGDGTKDHIYYSNTKVADSKITNITCKSRICKKTVTVQVPFDVNVDDVMGMMIEAAEENEKVVKDGSVPKPVVHFQEYSDRSMIKMRLEFYVWDYDAGGSTSGLIRTSILKKFFENGISVPMEAYEFTIVDFKGDVNES